MYQKDTLRKVREQRILHDVTLELTYRCNLDCFFCYNDREKQGAPLSLAQYKILLNDLAGMQTLYLMLTGGEPMMHPHFFEIGSMARELGFVTRIRTNGHSLNQALSERVKKEVDPYIVEVSLHGATAEVHDRQTRVKGSFDRLLENLENAKAAGLRCSIVSTPTAWNEHQIDDMYALCDSIDIPLRFQGPVAPKDNGDTEPLIIQPKKATWDLVEQRVNERRADTTTQRSASKGSEPLTARSDPEQAQPGSTNTGSDPASHGSDPFEATTKPEQKSLCGVGVVGVDIDPYGNVQACMHLQESAGNLHENSIEEIWSNSPLFQLVRARSVTAAAQFTDKSPEQFGAPLFCIAVEENANKGCRSCGGGCK